MMSSAMRLPHLTDTASVRAEAARDHGGLQDAGMAIQAWQAGLDPNTEALARKKVNPVATAEVQEDLEIAQEVIDNEFGEGTYRVLDAVVRGHGLSAVVEDQYGRPLHVAAPWDDKYRPLTRPVDEEAARANARAESHKGLLGSQARAEVQKMVEEATGKAVAAVTKRFTEAAEKLTRERDDAVERAQKLADEQQEQKGPGVEGDGQGQSGQPGATTEHTSSSKAEGDAPKKGEGPDGTGSSNDDDEAKWPRQHDKLDDFAKKNGVAFTDEDKTLDQKIEKLEGAGLKPPPKE